MVTVPKLWENSKTKIVTKNKRKKIVTKNKVVTKPKISNTKRNSKSPNVTTEKL